MCYKIRNFFSERSLILNRKAKLCDIMFTNVVHQLKFDWAIDYVHFTFMLIIIYRGSAIVYYIMTQFSTIWFLTVYGQWRI